MDVATALRGPNKTLCWRRAAAPATALLARAWADAGRFVRASKCVVELPEALKQNIIQTAPEIAPSQADYIKAVTEDRNPGWAIDPTERLRTRFAPTRTVGQPRLKIPDGLEWQQGPYAHQSEAVVAWESEPNPEQGTISMATGAGKTLTALICATRVQERLSNEPLFVVISAPSIPLVIQWQEEVKKFGINATVPSLETNTDVAITNLFRGLVSGGTHIAIVTNNLLCSPTFQSTVALKIRHANSSIQTMFIADEAHTLGADGFLSNKPDFFERPTFQSTVALKIRHANSSIQTMFIADEAHTLGADGFLSNKPDFFERRLALSATPERQYDPDGTEEIFDFFGSPVYEFGLDRAIGFCLSPYNYYVHAATLDGDELDEFETLTGRIGAALGRSLNDDDDTLTSLVIARRRIIETAQAKLALLQAVLEQRGPRSLEQTLIYASAKNPEQFDNIATMLTDLDIRWAPVTQDTTANRALLDQTLETFSAGGYQVLLAKKVLDEGIDIPSIREAFIVASSTVRREWIQRRGRVLRRHPEKPWAIVHDFLALPPAQMLQSEGTTNMKKIIQTELDRTYSFAAHARNFVGDGGVLSDLQRIKTAYWPEGEGSPILQQAGDSFIATTTPQGKPW